MAKSKMKVIAIFLIMVFMMSILTACGGGGGTEAKKIYMNFGAPPSSSSLYPYWVAVGKAIQKVYPEYQISVSESQGAVDITKRVRSGELTVGNSMSNTDYENYNGLGVFKDNPFKDVRILWYFDNTPIQMVVSKDSGVKDITDLNGKKFNPGGTGTSAALITRQICDVLGIKPDYFEAGQADAGGAVSNRQIVGSVKAGPAPDSFVMQIAATIAIDVISLTDEQIKKVNERYPYLVPVTIPAGVYKGVDHEVKTVQVMMGAQTTSKLSQEDGYKFIKAMNEGGKEVWTAAYPLGAKNNMLELALLAKTPLHAGAVQYLKEKGYNVPAELIPPEYKK